MTKPVVSVELTARELEILHRAITNPNIREKISNGLVQVKPLMIEYRREQNAAKKQRKVCNG